MMAPEDVDASAPSLPMSTSRTSSSLPTQLNTTSASAAASDGVAAIDPAYQLSSIGHLADGNLHLTVTGDGSLTDTGPIYLAVEEGLKASGGAISAEHGIGLAKRGMLTRNMSPGALQMMRAVKTALDPDDILNPGKVLA